MRLLNTTRVALRALRRNKMRSVLTALGIIIGVCSVIAMVSIGNGARAQIEEQVANLGQNVITVFAGSFGGGGVRGGWGTSSHLTVDDALAIQREVPGAVAVSPVIFDHSQVIGDGQNWYTSVIGAGPDYAEIRNWPVAEGSFFGESDVRSIAKVAVVGKTIVDELYPNENPLGKVIRIRNLPFKIIGVLAPKGFNLFGQDQDDIVIVPYTSHMKRISKRTYINSIMIEAVSEKEIPLVQQSISDLMLQQHNGRAGDFTVRNQVELAQTATATSQIMTMLLGAIASVSLVVGGIGIMNIMLVSVTERTREIGIRLAVGAHGRDVLMQFLTEAVILSSLGGLLGVVLGMVCSQLVSKYLGWPVLVSSSSVVISFGVSAVVGVFFGFYPARKAAQLDPIDALRYE
ncbi:macrolide export ATP-binding/permease protein MacB [mine drainage metagenome]|uniref:Macrolide export ATP-binding/permease protein MacB n=1 Tax=mine drainage metagenome TaxID=410659 RepID=A0A1J5TFI6_9ZZZZ